MNHERLQELAILHSTEGLEGAERLEYEIWLETANEEEMALFAQTVDLIGTLTVSLIEEADPPHRIKEKLMATIESEDDVNVDTVKSLAGYAFVAGVEGQWRQLPVKGARIKELSCSTTARTATFLLELDAGARLPTHSHEGWEEAFVLSGDLHMCGRAMQGGDYMRAGGGTVHHDLYSEAGCRALIFTSLSNYPGKSIRLFDSVHRVWRKCRKLLAK